MDILKIIIVFFLLTFSFGETIRIGLGDNLFIKPIDIFATGLFFFWIVKNFKSVKAKVILNDSLSVPIMLVVLVFLASLILNIKNFSLNEIFIAFSYALRWSLYASLYFVVKSFSQKFKEKVIYVLAVLGTVLVLFGFIQYFFYSSLRNLYYLGWDDHMHRMFSVFLDPNFAGAFFVLFLFFSLSLVLYLMDNNKKKQAWLLGLIACLTLLSVFLTYSRSALIMLLTTAITFAIVTRKIRLMLGIFLVGIIFIFISSKNFNIENVNLFRIASSEARLDSARTALRIISDNFVLGTGFNTYRYAQIKYGFRDPINSAASHADAGTDNSFLFVFATTGIIGLAAYIYLLKTMLSSAYKSHKNGNIIG
ncbi:MAG: O-antigen ligase family protein, partial [Candidatus Levybacteria bacterium]|nr:O-antigen ligase family protein [Candidatus Levybacteria bacterium]